MDVLAFIQTALSLAPVVVQLGGELATLAKQVTTAIQQPGGPTQADFDALTAYEAALRAQIDATIAADSA